MKKLYAVLFMSTVLLLTFTFTGIRQTAQATSCEAYGTSGETGIPPLSSISFLVDCAGGETAYFGVCDSGPVPNDDLFTLTLGGNIVSFNSYTNNQETVTILSSTMSAGSNIVTLSSVNSAFGATYSYAVSTQRSSVVSYLSSFCGQDFAGTSSLGACERPVPLFTTDAAPSDGTLVMSVQYGDFARQEGISVNTWAITEGQQINNASSLVPAPQYVRVWWQPEGGDWHLLTSQYWEGDGTTRSEYGIDCQSSAIPSYHTSFDSAIPESEVPALSQ